LLIVSPAFLFVFVTMHCTFFNAADELSRPSKVRGAILPGEYSLVQLLSKAEFSEPSWSVHTPARQWEGVKCNDEDEITDLNWVADFHSASSPRIRGELLWQHLPHTLVHFFAMFHGISGPVDLSSLPPALIEFNIDMNQFDGSLDLTNLPHRLEILSLAYNLFSGEIDLTRLPASIRELRLAGNDLCGDIDLTKLPASLSVLELLGNRINRPKHVPKFVDIGSS